VLDKKSGHRKKLLLVLLPNPGIIDQWLPVIDRMGSRVDLVLFSPHPSNLYQLRDDDQMVKILSSHIKRVVFRVDGVGWFHAGTIKKAKEINRACVKGARFFRGGNGFGRRYVLKMIRLGIGWAGRLRFRRHVTDINVEIAAGDKIIGDFGAFNETCMEDVVTALSGCDIYSLDHGNVPVRSGEGPAALDQSLLNASSVNFYAFSERPEKNYRARYSLPKQQIGVVGIPRHDYAWISQVQKLGKVQEFSQCIYVVSRPSNKTYHPVDRKILALRDIKEVADRLGLPVVIRSHPKEFQESVFFDVFGRQDYGRNWVTTQEHSYCAGRNAVFAVVFHSGVCVDMTRIGVPTIERLNLEGLPSHHTAGLSCGFDTAEPMTSYLAAGLVLPARSRVEFLAQVERVLSDRDGVVTELKEAYAKYFSEPNIQRIVDEILY